MLNFTNTNATAATAATTISSIHFPDDTVANIGASTFAPAFHYNTKDPHSIYIDEVDVTEVFHEYTDVLKKESLAREAAKPKPKPADPVKSITINPAAGTTTVVFKDGSVSMVHCNDEEFDPEKGIAMCFMKKMFDCRGCFNDFLNKYLDDKNWIYKNSKSIKTIAGKSFDFSFIDETVNTDLIKELSKPKNNYTISIQPKDANGFLDLTEDDWKEIFAEDSDETK